MAFSAAILPNAAWAEGFNSASWFPEKAPPLGGALKKNYKLSHLALIGKGKLKGPEDVTIDEKGHIYCGSTKKGEISRISVTADGAEHVEVFAQTGGWNLGLQLLSNGNLLSCNVPRGILSISPEGKVTCLTNKSDDGSSITFADDLDVDSEGKVYFSNASSKYNGFDGNHSLKYDFLEGKPHGALYLYDPTQKSTKQLLDGLYFANGVALAKDEDFVLVVESGHYQVTRYWLKGPKAGTHDIFAKNLPGIPDGINRDASGDYWVALPSPRRKYHDFLQHSPGIKNFLSHTPVFLWGSAPHYGMVVRLNPEGEIVESLQDPTGKVWAITNAVPWKDYLFLGSLEADFIARYQK